MRNTMVWTAAFATVMAGACAQDIAGIWQGEAGQDRYVLRVGAPPRRHTRRRPPLNRTPGQERESSRFAFTGSVAPIR